MKVYFLTMNGEKFGSHASFWLRHRSLGPSLVYTLGVYLRLEFGAFGVFLLGHLCLCTLFTWV